MSEKILIVIAGPTAVGKTDISIKLAKTFNAPILSADSRQFYREMSIGTAKPSNEQLKEVPHFFIDNLSISEKYSVGRYESEALEVLNDLYQHQDIVFLVGGSGLFIKAVTEGLDTFPEIDFFIRDELNQQYQKEGLDPILKELERKDPGYFEIVDKKNHRRVIRALEIIRQTNSPFSFFWNKGKNKRRFTTVKMGLNTDREALYDRINQRVDKMMKAGLLNEVKSLYEYKYLSSLNTVGYKEIFSFIDGALSKEEAIEEIKKNTRRFAKRQLTWFKNSDNLEWFNPEEYEKMERFIVASI
jgi:tRNA dimethylallyltransferase